MVLGYISGRYMAIYTYMIRKYIFRIKHLNIYMQFNIYFPQYCSYSFAMILLYINSIEQKNECVQFEKLIDCNMDEYV